MKQDYESLDDYLNALDAIKEQVAQKTQGMTAKEVTAYFSRASKALEELTGQYAFGASASQRPEVKH
jgi:hypothetical protein